MSGFTAGMLAKLTRAQLRTQAMFPVAGGVISPYFGEVSQAVPAAMSQVLRRHGTHLGDPGAVSEGEGKSKRAEKYGTKKSKERREESLGTMSYQTSSKRSRPFCLLIGARKLLRFSDKFQNFSILLAPLRKYEEKSLGRDPYLFSHLALSCFCFCLFFFVFFKFSLAYMNVT